jgi:hypothetical protein
MFKFHNSQAHMSPDRLRDRLKIARLYVELTRTICDLAFGAKDDGSGADVESLLVLLCIFVGDAEGRATTPTKVASHSGLSRQSVYRRLKLLERRGKIIKVGTNYRLTEGAVTPDSEGKIDRILNDFIRK